MSMHQVRNPSLLGQIQEHREEYPEHHGGLVEAVKSATRNEGYRTLFEEVIRR